MRHQTDSTFMEIIMPKFLGWKKGPATTLRTIFFFFFIFFLLLFITLYISSTSTFLSIKRSTRSEPVPSSTTRFIIPVQPEKNRSITPNIQAFPQRVLEFKFPDIDCSGVDQELKNTTQTCNSRESYPAKAAGTKSEESNGRGECPSYFRWIHEDLKPWKATGITREALEKGRGSANFRLVILKGKVYVEKYNNKKPIQSRDKFTIWGILQLLRKYPGKLPDLELMFDCDDRPVIRSEDYKAALSLPPPLFRYCGDRWTMDIVFPDWSFWGWAEINIRPWHNLLKELKEGNERMKWEEREPYAYWKGNPFVADDRKDLLTCNVSREHDWGARLFIQDWIKESQQGFKESSLAKQCKHKYKIYIEGYAWSVSEKYILACDSVTFLVKPYYYDFFTRSLEPLVHYWPIERRDKCQSIKFGVEWGNQNPDKARAIGKAASDFIHEKVNMDYIYDYMFHLLSEYGKLLRFEPRVPTTAVEVCAESMACGGDDEEDVLGLGLVKKFMLESLVKSPLISPCEMMPPFETKDLEMYYKRNLNTIRRVHKWESQYWQDNKNHG